MKTKALLLTLALGASTCLVISQDANPRPAGQGQPGAQGAPGRPGGPGGPGGPRFVLPIIAALDLNSNGTIDADEIAKASESLKTLDKNKDGKITPDEMRPEGRGRPGGPGGPEGAPRRDRPPQ